MTAAPARPRSLLTRTIIVLAVRNLRRQLRRTTLTTAVMVIGGALLIFSFALGDGVHETWIESGIRTSTGHVTIEQPEFRLSRKLEDRLPTDVRTPDRARARIARDRAVRRCGVGAAQYQRPGELGGRRATGAGPGGRPGGRGPVQHARRPAGRGPVSQSRRPAGRLHRRRPRLEPGIGAGLTPRRAGAGHRTRDCRTAAPGRRHLQERRPEVDQAVVHIPLQTGGDWLGSGRDVTNVGVVLTGTSAVAPVTAHLEETLSDPIGRRDARVMGWRAANPALAAAIALDDLGNYLVFGILFVIIAFGSSTPC